jgi:hypothetical protein
MVGAAVLGAVAVRAAVRGAVVLRAAMPAADVIDAVMFDGVMLGVATTVFCMASSRLRVGRAPELWREASSSWSAFSWSTVGRLTFATGANHGDPGR